MNGHKRPRLCTKRLKDPAPVGSTWADWLTALCKNKCHLPIPRTSEHSEGEKGPSWTREATDKQSYGSESQTVCTTCLLCPQGREEGCCKTTFLCFEIRWLHQSGTQVWKFTSQPHKFRPYLVFKIPKSSLHLQGKAQQTTPYIWMEWMDDWPFTHLWDINWWRDSSLHLYPFSFTHPFYADSVSSSDSLFFTLTFFLSSLITVCSCEFSTEVWGCPDWKELYVIHSSLSGVE